MRQFLKALLKNLQLTRSFSPNRWRYLLLNLSDREKTTVAGLLIFIAATLFFLAGYDYWVIRAPAPAEGGGYTEGIVGEPRYLNPVLGANNEADRDIITLIFAGLTKHNETGNIVGDLAESIEIKEKGRVYEFILKPDLRWPDDELLTADDVIFTINLIQNPEYQSPIRASWQGVRAEKIDERTVRLTLNLPYKPFLENTTVGILPQHLWENIKPQNFALAELNIKPVGAGPYRVKKVAKDASGSIRSLELVRNKTYHSNVYIDKISVKFYPNEDELVNASRSGAIEGLSLFSPRSKKDVEGRDVNFHTIKMPRYFAAFFNEDKNDILESISVRQALAHATSRGKIVAEILLGEALEQEGPLPLWILSETTEFTTYEFNEDKARQILTDAGWEDEDGDGTREKKAKKEEEPRRLEFTLTTTDWPELTQVASILKEQWERVGFLVNLDIIPVVSIQQQVIRPREYEVLLFGEVLGTDTDPFSFWHSSQVKDPGLNLSSYSNKKVDSLLETARQAFDEEVREEKFEELQQIITKDLPAIFLYSPHYVYALPKKIRGVETALIGSPSQRFENANNWYIKTTRTRER